MALLDDDSPQECRICFNDFDEGERRPRNLPCGHTFCTLCIAGTFRVNRFTCPSCRAPHVALDVTVFPVSYIAEAFVRYVRRRSPEHEALGRRPPQEEEIRLRKLIFGCQETQTHLDHCAAEVAKSGREATRLATRIDAIAEHNRRVLQHMLDDHRRVVGKCGGGGGAVGGAVGDEQPFSPRSRLDFHGALAAMPMDAAAYPESASGCGAAAAAAEQPVSPRDPSAAADRFRLSRITEQIESATAAVRRRDASIWETSQSVAKYKKGVRGRSGVVGELEAGGVYALDETALFPGASPPRSARMTLADEKLYLHVLKDQPAPPYARVLKHCEAMQLMDPFYSVVFLEMGWGGAARGRVHIRLTPNDRRAQQFLSLCTGQAGRSYVDTQLLQVGYKGRPGEYVVGGGLDDVAIEEEELGRECQKRASVGLVWGWCEADGHTGPGSLGSGSRFAITTKHPGPGTSYCRVFGKVEAGLEVLKAATKLKDITEVSVLDCGIVVTF
ncbi:uncharacterized protein LOC122264409 [Penaeus japonicus]|uniref:uncharacterized protein LOC122263011 n=1 Tax=Penaeus japonicus TaxID=27405 RepID=UPI001C710BA2|nr:uncharacterized protein LOC122263011 [Penaeus japonicus]XP_042889215.1 uncharacterized protein LOC122264409 [Penaeus japonicus]